MSWTFNAPPGWAVPPGFVPPEGWVPDPTWPPAPEGWTFWVAAEASTAAQPPDEVELDPFHVPAPGSVPTAPAAATAGWGAPAAPVAGYGSVPAGYPTPGYPAAGYPAPGYPAPGYGAPGYPPPGYPPAGYGAAPYGASPYAPAPRRPVRGWVVALIVGVVLLIIGLIVVGVVVAARGIGKVVGPAIRSDIACSDALFAIEDDDAPPTPAQARAALPELRDAEASAAEGIDGSPLVGPSDVLLPIRQLIAGYTVFSTLPDAPSTWTPAQRTQAVQAEADIDEAASDLDSWCGYDDGSGTDGGTRNVGG